MSMLPFFLLARRKIVINEIVFFFNNFSYAVEIVGGLGPTAGLIIRIGLMGENAKLEYVETALKVLRESFSTIRALSNL